MLKSLSKKKKSGSKADGLRALRNATKQLSDQVAMESESDDEKHNNNNNSSDLALPAGRITRWQVHFQTLGLSMLGILWNITNA